MKKQPKRCFILICLAKYMPKPRAEILKLITDIWHLTTEF